jgi:HAD superfamily hydrolase (TIGR01509 family)
MRFAELDAVTVDGYGTLLVLDDPVPRLRDALAAHGVDRDEEDVAKAFAAEVHHYRPRAHLGRDAPSLTALRLDCVGVFLAALGDSLSPADFVEDFLAALSFSAVPGALETLQLLRDRKLRLAVVANWDFALPQHLNQLGLDGFFSAVVTSAAAGVAKPDPGIFRLALQRLGVEPSRALHVGDEPADEGGARAAGMLFARAPLAHAFEHWS